MVWKKQIKISGYYTDKDADRSVKPTPSGWIGAIPIYPTNLKNDTYSNRMDSVVRFHEAYANTLVCN